MNRYYVARTGFQSCAIVIGVVTTILAVAAFATGSPAGQLFDWSLQSMGRSFLCLLVILSVLSLFSWLTLKQEEPSRALYVLGIHAANGIATIALTYTLFGISKGIGGLAEASLTPETVAAIISDLTHGFQLAFITTVVGLPISALLRAMLHVAGTQVFPHE